MTREERPAAEQGTPPHGVDVWWTRLTDGPGPLPAGLSDDERARAQAMVPSVGRRFASARWWVRTILARYLACHPADVAFRYGPFGQPFLDVPDWPDPPRIGIAHTGAHVALAVARVAVGVDVEATRRAAATMPAVIRYLAANEQAAIAALPPSERPRAFTDCWTRKEAFAKALGRGLGLPFRRFEVSVGPEAAIIATADVGESPSSWTLATIGLDADVRLSVAARVCPCMIRVMPSPGDGATLPVAS